MFEDLKASQWLPSYSADLFSSQIDCLVQLFLPPQPLANATQSASRGDMFDNVAASQLLPSRTETMWHGLPGAGAGVLDTAASGECDGLCFQR